MFSLATKLHLILIMTIVGVAIYMYLLYKEIKVFEADISTLKMQVLSLMPIDVNKIMESLGNSTAKQQEKKEKQEKLVKPMDDVKPEKRQVITNNDDDDDASVTSNEIRDIITNIQDVDDIIEQSNQHGVEIKNDKEGSQSSQDNEANLDGQIDKIYKDVEDIQNIIQEVQDTIGIGGNQEDDSQEVDDIDINLKKDHPFTQLGMYAIQEIVEIGRDEKSFVGMSVEEIATFKADDLRLFLKNKGHAFRANKSKADMAKLIFDITNDSL